MPHLANGYSPVSLFLAHSSDKVVLVHQGKLHAMKIHVVILAICIFCLACSDSSSSRTTATEELGPDIDTGSNPTPNFLFIISDDQGLDASAQYALSQDVPNTPVLNALAESGIVFDNAWATPSCTTTRGSIISGQHGVNSGVATTPSLMDANTNTMQRFLGNTSTTSSYSSAVIGKWHLAGGNTNNLLSHPNDSGVGYYAGNISGTIDDYSDWPLTINGNTTTSNTYHTTHVTDLAIDWIEQQQNPWFMWLAYVSPHSPFHLPPEDLHTQTLPGTSADINANPRSYYLAAIEAMDTEIGRLLDSLPSSTRDNTMIVFLGDNGTPRAVIDTAAYERSHGKNSLYEGGIRVPMIVSGQGVDRLNEREAALVNTVDLFATISEAADLNPPQDTDGQSFLALLSDFSAPIRAYNYSEFVSNDTHGWTVRDANYKLIVFADGTQELYQLQDDPREINNLMSAASDHQATIGALRAYGLTIHSSDDVNEPIDITGATLVSQSVSCESYVTEYTSTATDILNNQNFVGSLSITIDTDSCVLSSNAIPSHDFNDGSRAFPNDVSEQQSEYRITKTPSIAASTTPLSLTVDNAILLNGVKIDILAAGCFGVGNGRVGCGDPTQPWRYDPMNPAAGFLIDSHNAHSQPDGTYHYHGKPNALYSEDGSIASPVVGFAADGFPIFGSFIHDGNIVRAVQPSYRLKSGERPSGSGNPGGSYDGTFRDDYEYVAGLGDLDECNGMMVNGSYRYYLTDEYPYAVACFKGTPDTSFSKR